MKTKEGKTGDPTHSPAALRAAKPDTNNMNPVILAAPLCRCSEELNAAVPLWDLRTEEEQNQGN